MLNQSLLTRVSFILNLIFILVLSSPFAFPFNEAKGSTVSTYIINAPKDDAWSKVDDVKWDDDKYYLSNSTIIAGCRWSIDIPKGSLILQAYFICKAKSDAESFSTVVRIAVFDQDSCRNFDEIFWDWPVMEEYVDWELPSFSQDMWYTSPDISSLIQAYIDRAGYESGNFIGLRFKFQTGLSAGHEVWSWDGDVESAAKLEVTYIAPQPPVAEFTYVPDTPLTNETITFNASATYSPNGSIIEYCWDFGDDTPLVNETDPVTFHAYEIEGTYTVTLTVVDTNGLTNSTSKTVEVHDPHPPLVAFSYSPDNPLVDEEVTFNASATYSPDGSIDKYCWDFGDGSPIVNETDPVTLHIYKSGGIYTVTLTVIDTNGLTNSTSKLIEVRELQEPLAAFDYFPTNPLVAEKIIFNASQSCDLDGYIVSYEWSFGDGNVTITDHSVISHVYFEAGSYNVTLTVTDNDGQSQFTWQTISVNLHDVAIVNVVISSTEVQIGQPVNITVTVKNEGTLTETFNVTVFCNDTIIDSLSIFNLLPGEEEVLTFHWDTSHIQKTTKFIIRAEISKISGESDTEDNAYTAGTISIKEKGKESMQPPVSYQLDWRWIPLIVLSAFLLAVGVFLRRKTKKKPRSFEFFDEITGGGIPDSFSVLILGSPASGKSVLCQQLAYQFLNKGKSCVYITYDCFPNEIRENMKSFNWDVSKYEEEGKFVFIDCFSPIAKVTNTEGNLVNQPFSLSELGIAISRVTSQINDSPRVFLDSVVPLLTQIDPQKVIEFLQNRSARIKGINGTFIFTVGKETVTANLISRLEEVVDCIIELDVKSGPKETLRKMRIKKMRGRRTSEKWVRYEITQKKGILFLL